MTAETAPPTVDHLVIAEEFSGTTLHTLRLSLSERSFFYSRSGSVVMGAFNPERHVLEWVERHAVALSELNGRTSGSAGKRTLTITYQRGQEKFEARFNFDARDQLPAPVAALYGEYHDLGRRVAQSHDPSAARRMPGLEHGQDKPWWKFW